MNYCLPIIAPNKELLFSTITEQKDVYHSFEIWTDYLEDVRESDVLKLAHEFGERLIIVLRRKNFEQTRRTPKEQHQLITSLSGTHVLIDCDITQQKQLLDTITKAKLALLLSYHNYTETPQDQSLQEILSEMKHYNPAIYKIATMCNTESDALRLLALQQQLKKENRRHIILGMGEYGTITRVYGTLWGNEMIFAPVTEDKASAPGQLTKKQLEKIFMILSSRQTT